MSMPDSRSDMIVHPRTATVQVGVYPASAYYILSAISLSLALSYLPFEADPSQIRTVVDSLHGTPVACNSVASRRPAISPCRFLLLLPPRDRFVVTLSLAAYVASHTARVRSASSKRCCC